MNELSLEITGTAYSDIEKITDFIIAAIKMTEMFYFTIMPISKFRQNPQRFHI